MSTIHTITLNPAVDHVIRIGKFTKGEVIRAEDSTVTAAGKGINVARTVSCMKKQVSAHCFVGKNEVHLYKSLNSKYMKPLLYPVTGTTRSNITVTDSGHRLVTHLQTKGFDLNDQLLQSLILQLEKRVTGGDVLVISGSTPGGVPVSFYRGLIEEYRQKGCLVLFDSSGQYYKTGLEGIPYAIKPNDEELKELAGREFSKVQAIVKEAKVLNKKGIELVFVSRGKKGVILTKKDHSGYWKANVKLPSGERKGNEIGCGDAMMGGIALSLSFRYDPEEMLRMAVACGAANLLSPGPGICDPADVKDLFTRASVRFFH